MNQHDKQSLLSLHVKTKVTHVNNMNHLIHLKQCMHKSIFFQLLAPLQSALCILVSSSDSVRLRLNVPDASIPTLQTHACKTETGCLPGHSNSDT